MCPLSIPYPPLHHTCAGYRTNRETEQQSHRPQPTMNTLCTHTMGEQAHHTAEHAPNRTVRKSTPRLAPKLMSRSTSRHTICRGEILFWAQNPHNQQHPKTPTSKQSHEKHQENRLVLFLASKLQNSLFPSPLAVGHFRWFHIQYVEGANKCSI